MVSNPDRNYSPWSLIKEKLGKVVNNILANIVTVVIIKSFIEILLIMSCSLASDIIATK